MPTMLCQSYLINTQISTSVLREKLVMIMQTVLILMVVTGVSVCQDSREMDTTVQVSLLQMVLGFNWSLTLGAHMQRGLL